MSKAWKGADDLRPFLVPIDSLEPFKGNPRRGDIAEIRGSLRRFGQVKPIIRDGDVIVAGHHVRIAMMEEGFTEIAAIQNTFGDFAEARAYLLADNRIGDLGTYDTAELVEHLKQLDEFTMVGTGYTPDDLADQMAELDKMQKAAVPDDGTKREHRDPGMKELVLNFSAARLKQVEIFMGMIAKEKGTEGTSDTVYAALEDSARRANS